MKTKICFIFLFFTTPILARDIYVGSEMPHQYEQVMAKMFSPRARLMPLQGKHADRAVIIRNGTISSTNGICAGGKPGTLYDVAVSDDPSPTPCGNNRVLFSFGFCLEKEDEDDLSFVTVKNFRRFTISSHNPGFGIGWGFQGDTLEISGLNDKDHTSVFLRTMPTRETWETAYPEWNALSGDHYLFGTFKNLRWCN